MKTKILLLVMALTFLTSCDSTRKLGGGINGSMNTLSKAALCETVGKQACLVGAAILGFVDGIEERRDEITGENKEKRSERIVDEVLTKKGFDVKEKCGLLWWRCW